MSIRQKSGIYSYQGQHTKTNNNKLGLQVFRLGEECESRVKQKKQTLKPPAQLPIEILFIFNLFCLCFISWYFIYLFVYFFP